MLAKLLLPALLLAVSTASLAQQPATAAQTATTLTPEQKAQIEKQNQGMAQAATQVAQMVDQGKLGDIWDGASSVAKKAVSRDVFIKTITKDRKQLGALQSRRVVAVSRLQSNGGATPIGNYINVAFASQFAHAKQLVRELVSFHLDPDNVWRVSGYTVH